MYTHKVEYSSPKGATLYCEVDYTCHFGHSGRTFGPPECCEPPEPSEIQITDIRPLEDEIIEELLSRLEQMPGSEESVKAFWAPIIDWITNHCHEELVEHADDVRKARELNDALDDLRLD